MTEGNFYMHKDAMDLCIYITEKWGKNTFFIEWHNLGYVGKPYSVGHTQWIELTQDEQKDWLLLTYGQLTQSRRKVGYPWLTK